MRLNAHYNVAPRYSGGSPAQVNEQTAHDVVRDERRAYQRTLEGAYGAEDAAKAKQLGLRGIAELRREVANAWLVEDLITGERFLRPFYDRGEKPAVAERRELRLKEKHRLPLERELPAQLQPPVPVADYTVTNHGSIFLVHTENDVARRNLEEHVGDDAQWHGGALAVEHRYIEHLVQQLREEGWTVA